MYHVSSCTMPLQMMENDDKIIETIDVDDAYFIKSESGELCRLCANTDNQLIPIYDGEGLAHEISNKIDKYLPIKVTETDKLPLQICFQCASSLIAWHNLYEGCIIADKRLRDVLSNDKVYEFDVMYEDTDGDPNEYDGQSQTKSASVTVVNMSADEINKNALTEVVQIDETAAVEPELHDERSNDDEYASMIVDAAKSDDTDPIQTENASDEQYDNEEVVPVKCSVCGDDIQDVRIVEDEYCCETCCRIKIEPESDQDVLPVVDMAPLSDTTYQCALCDKVYRKKKNMISHMKDHNKKIFTCTICGSTYRTREQLKTHKKRHVRKTADSTLIFCEICKKYFKTKKGFAYHQRKICKQYKCYICNEKFLVDSVLEDHMKKMHDVKPPPIDDNTVSTANEGETVMSVCPICGKVVTQAVLPRHMILHSENKPFTCDMCGKSFKRKHSLQDHIMIEMGMKNYVCDICGMKFLKQGYLNKHVRYHKLNNGEFQGFPCEVCGKKFPEKWRLGVHQRAVHKGGKFASCKCEICGNTFAERWMVRLHKHKEHGGEEVTAYRCDICGKTFLEKWMIRAHQRSTHKAGTPKLYCYLCGHSDHMPKDCSHRDALQESTCVLCGEAFASGYLLKEHVVSVHNFDDDDDQKDIKIVEVAPTSTAVLDITKNVLHLCAGCGMQFDTKQHLKAHETSSGCTDSSTYECQECGKQYHSKASLANHVMAHKKSSVTNIYRCELCNKEFVTAEALQEHGSMDKICLLCGNVYGCNDQLQNHVFAEHSDNADDLEMVNTGDRPFECKLCGKRFARKQAMQNHMYAEMNLRRYVCEFCDKSYNYYSHLKEHIVTNHGKKEHVCGYCGKDFPTKKRFRDHVTLHSEEKPFGCRCGLSFKLNRYLSKHKKRCKTALKQEAERCDETFEEKCTIFV